MFNKLFQVPSKKSYRNTSVSLMDMLCGKFDYAENLQQFIDYYIESSPVFTATKLIADTASSIDILIKNKKNDEIMYEHPALALLSKPCPFSTKKLFLKEIFSYYVLTGNCYINIIGNGKPVELDVLNPAAITIQPSSIDGYPQEYNYSQINQQISFNRDDKKKFVARNGNQLAHLREFNPKYSSNNLVGLSVFAGVQLEISQYILASIHNNSLLKNQGRPSGLISFVGDETSMSEEQATKIQEQIQERLQGAANAGRPLFLSGKFQWQQLSESTKDMDFDNLKRTTSQAIYNAAKIPLPMISPDNMTLANMDAAKYNFYDNCILPVFKSVLSFLTENVLSRYPNSENLEFWFDEADIEALEMRKSENIRNLYQSGLINLNEARNEIGWEQIDGGNNFYLPMNLIPIGSDTYTQDQRRQPKKSAEKAVEKAEYIRLMSSLTDLKGARLYDDDFINKKLEIYYG